MSTAKIDPRIFFNILCLLICYSVFAVDRRNMVAFKIDLNEKQELFEYLEKQHFTLLYEITPTTYIFKYNGEGTLSQSLQTAIDDNKKRIVAVESVKIQEKNTILQGKADYYDESSSPQMASYIPLLVLKIHFTFITQ
ncbi:uncharacterized protein LOC128548670 [Mercenaria mercenaria]|uniref:uncharacterized protein LOC128548670 n=1 Tax=Mercenaria mercenaria TaxID=6596 RepID=UPI00234F89D1|nr:uncharacterized protein LOC128548670 [Mercenaria mercenaria]